MVISTLSLRVASGYQRADWLDVNIMMAKLVKTYSAVGLGLTVRVTVRCSALGLGLPHIW